jgi:hypothetical protein
LIFFSQDEDSPPSTNQNKGKLNQVGSKSERDEGDDEGESRHGGESGKGMPNFDCGGKQIKQEVKTEPMDHDSIKGTYLFLS